MSARTDALMSWAETGKMRATSIVPVASGCHPAVRIVNPASRLWFGLACHAAQNRAALTY
ncbi:hypothetical protein QRQ56_03670 [Bradyrhizobium sp. U531]|uniref:hypothetical protein n=1 Tax=Bradyrhizobium sp. U531 TaxID=3053458 RepID=UPI003F42EC8C